MLTFFNLIPKWVLAAIIAMLSATSCKLHWDKNGLIIDVEKAKVAVAEADTRTAKVREEHLTLVAQSETAAGQAIAEAAKTTHNLQVAMDTQRRKLNETTLALNTERDNQRLRYAGLQKRFAATTYNLAASPPPNPASVGQTPRIDNFTEFSNPIGDLIEEAGRAEVIRNALLMCYKSYDDAKAKLEEPTPDSNPNPAK